MVPLVSHARAGRILRPANAFQVVLRCNILGIVVVILAVIFVQSVARILPSYVFLRLLCTGISVYLPAAMAVLETRYRPIVVTSAITTAIIVRVAVRAAGAGCTATIAVSASLQR